MADILKAAMSVTFTEEDINKSSRYLDATVSHEPITHEKGKATIPGNTTDLEIATNVNFCMVVLDEGKPFNYKVGSDTTAQELANCRFFAYDANTANVYISNTDTDPIKIEFVTAKY